MRKPTVFLRDATGLVKDLSAKDAFFFNVLTVSLLFFTLWTYPPYVFPGGDMTLATVLFVFVSIPMWVVYAMLASAMPRTGGDYIYQSRALPGSFAFALNFSSGVFWTISFLGWAGWWFIFSGFAPLLIRFGLLYNDTALLNLGIWSTTLTGIVVISTVLMVSVAFLHFFGLRLFVKLQKVMFVAVAACSAVLIGIFATTTPSSFATTFNAVMQPLANSTNYYQSTIATAATAGFNANPQFSWFNTIGIFSILSGTMVYFALHVYFGGEVKHGSELKKQLFATVGADLIFGLLVCALGTWLFLRAVGVVFWNSFSFNSYTGSLTSFYPGLPPNIISLATIMTSNPILILIITVGMMLQSYFIFFNSSLPQAREMFAMTFDRMFPAKFADVSDKFHTPIKLILGIMVVGEIWVFLINYTTWAALFATYLAWDIMMFFTMVTGILFPFLKGTKRIYEASPAAKYKMGGIPLISICGVCGLTLLFIIIYFIAATPTLGFANYQSEIAMAAIFLAAFVYYFIVKAYRKKEGIDIGMIFKEIPPE